MLDKDFAVVLSSIEIIILMIELIVLMYVFRWDKEYKWYMYLLPLKKVKNIPKVIVVLYYIFSFGSALIAWINLSIDNWGIKVIALFIYLLFSQYFMYGVLWIAKMVLDIIMCLDDAIFVCSIFLPGIFMLLISTEEVIFSVRIVMIMLLAICIINIILMLRHLIILVTNQEYRIRISNKYYSDRCKKENSIIRMKLEIVLAEYIILVMQLSILVYLFMQVSPDIDWIWDNREVISYANCLYYAITSFTSVGYNDIIPSSFLAKGIDVIISIIGVIFTGCIVGLILGNDDSILDKEKKMIEVKQSIGIKSDKECF